MKGIALELVVLALVAGCGEDPKGVVVDVVPDVDAEVTADIDTATPDGEVTVAPAPLATDDSASVDEDHDAVIAVSLLLANDVDNGGGALAVSTVGEALHGAVVLDGTSVTFTPATNFSGEASFVYTIIDPLGGSDSARVAVTVVPVADPPRLLDARGDAGSAIALPVVALVDDDGSEVLSDIHLTGVPGTFVVSAGTIGETSSAGSFAPAAAVPFGTSTRDVLVGRFDADGLDDLATIDSQSNTVGILLGRGDGTFQISDTRAVGASPGGIISGRFDGDDFEDVAVTNFKGASISVCLGQGDGTLAPCTTVAGNQLPGGIAVGHFHDDGIADLVTADFSQYVTLFRGDGQGGFALERSIDLPTPGNEVRVARLDADDLDDLVVSQGNCSEDCIKLFFGNGDGTFTAPVSFDVGVIPGVAAVGDVNADGLADLIVPVINSASVSVFLGHGDGTFEQLEPFTVKTPTEVALGSFDGDAFVDLAVTAVNERQVTVLSGRGDGTFVSPTLYTVGSNPFGIARGRFDGDALDDLVLSALEPEASAGGLQVLLQARAPYDVTLAASELPDLTISPPADFSGEVELGARATSTESANGAAATTTGTLTLTVDPRAPSR